MFNHWLQFLLASIFLQCCHAFLEGCPAETPGSLVWGMFTGGANSYGDKGCVSPATEGLRLRFAQLYNIQGDWDSTCRNTYGKPPGSGCRLPDGCANKGMNGEFGFWWVFDPACLPQPKNPTYLQSCPSNIPSGNPNWGSFARGDCGSPGYRVYWSRLWNIQGDWRKVCESTYGQPTPNSGCRLPDWCTVQWDAVGRWFVRDDSCRDYTGIF